MLSRSVPAAIEKLRDFARLVKLEHTLFAMPFSLGSMLIAARGMPPARTALLIVGALVCGRTLAMAANRVIDRHVDAANPRTRSRELPSGRLSLREVLALCAVALAGLIACVWSLPPLCLNLLPLAVLIVVGYSYMKFRSCLSHVVLGLALATPVVGSQIAVTGRFPWEACPLALAVVTWVAGFDILYACQDIAFDRGAGLHSIPARFGLEASLRWAPRLHLCTPLLLAVYGQGIGLGPRFLAGCVIICAILAWEHTICRGGDMARIDRAFFDANVAVSLTFLATCAAAVL